MGALDGKNILLTGASRGFGLQLAGWLWNEGANLLLVARDGVRLRAVRDALRERAQSEQCCYTAEHDLDNTPASWLVEFARQKFDRLDGLVNNAALQGPIGAIWQCDPLAIRETLNVNLLVPMALCRLVLPWMFEYNRGKIVNLSGGGATSPRPGYATYAASKAGLVQFSAALAEELKDRHISVNCVAPGELDCGMSVKPGQPYNMQAIERACACIVFLLSWKADEITGRLIAAQWDDWEHLKPGEPPLDNPDTFTLRRVEAVREK